VDLSEQYKERIVDYMFNEYENGRTPNPDVLCNREIKFDVFMKIALELGADFVATGHYCQKEEEVINGKTVYKLVAGKDPNKDQSYFLCQLSQEQLAKALFPIGGYLKSEVREIAVKHDLITAEKKDSQGLCFIGKVRLPEFLQQQLKPKKGIIYEVSKDHEVFTQKKPSFDSLIEELTWEATSVKYTPEMGKKVGEHNGAHYFTIGQRKGLNVGGTQEPLFIISTDVKENSIYTGQGQNHPGLFRHTLLVQPHEIHWIREDLALKDGESLEVMARIRYRQPLQEATLYQTSKGIFVRFKESQSAITEGQFVSWHLGEELIGSGVISKI
ncbi:MAG TPA: tRNA 2-thiouridine(34) synthase MnmA, partial [Flavobacterium sp.]|nr:tRNA 2-thiouridine(34) synthase MnmA [Flavobacterium sp.]